MPEINSAPAAETVAEPVATPVAEPAAEPSADAPEADTLQVELEKLRKEMEAKNKRIAEADFTLKKTTKDFADFKRSHLSETEQLKEQQQATEAEAKQLKIDRNTIRAEKILMGGQLAEDDYKDILGHIVSDDPDKTEDLAQGIVDLITRKATAAAKAEREKVLKETPQPPTGGADTAAPDPFIEAFTKG